MKKLNNFIKFNESSVTKYLSEEDIEDIFIELIDDGYVFNFYNESPGVYYFDCRRNFRCFDFEVDSRRYGCRDLDSMSKQIERVLLILKVAKDRINDMGYDIGFLPEFNFSEDSLFSITFHMCHNSIERDDDSMNAWGQNV